MQKTLKRALIALLLLVAIAGAAYGGYKLYQYGVKFITEKITRSVAKGVVKGVGDTINPFKWPGKLFGQ